MSFSPRKRRIDFRIAFILLCLLAASASGQSGGGYRVSSSVVAKTRVHQ